MKAKCFNCGKEFDWEEDYQPCIECDGTGTDGVGRKCILCGGVGAVDVNADDVPVCEDCMLMEEEAESKDISHKPIKNTKVTFLRLDEGE